MLISMNTQFTLTGFHMSSCYYKHSLEHQMYVNPPLKVVHSKNTIVLPVYYTITEATVLLGIHNTSPALVLPLLYCGGPQRELWDLS